MTEINDRIETALDTDPLKLRDALDAVLARCSAMELDFEGKPSFVGRAIAEQIRSDIAAALKR